MKILWLSNIIVPIVCKELGIPCTVLGGWMDDLANRLSVEHEMVFVFPNKEKTVEGHNKNIKYYGFKKCNELFFTRVLSIEKPDIIHIWGTEGQHSMYMMRASSEYGMRDRTVVSIQGLVHYIAKYHYCAGLPADVITRHTFHDVIVKNNIYQQCIRFERRGRDEIEVLKNAKYVIGRTEWDYESVKLVNPNMEYFHCNESLREPFYEKEWDIDRCDKVQIFMSQGQYPLKGLHMAIHALHYIVERFPDIKLVVIAKDVQKQPFYKLTGYQSYIRELLNNYKLMDNVVFCSQMNASLMAETICKSRVFINSSSIENSSNSLGEAMLIGCPCVASNVGGTNSFISDGVDGFLYPFNEPYILATKLLKLLLDDKLSKMISLNARKRAAEVYNREDNYSTMIDIYTSICKNTV